MRERMSFAGRSVGVGIEGVEDALRMRLARAREWRRFSGLGVSEEGSEKSTSISGVSWVWVTRSCMSIKSPDARRGGRIMLDMALEASSESIGCAGAMNFGLLECQVIDI